MDNKYYPSRLDFKKKFHLKYEYRNTSFNLTENTDFIHYKDMSVDAV
jgi:hypothetical protein